MTTRILIIGSSGQIGFELCRRMAPLGEITALDYPEIDLASPDSIRSCVRAARPQLIVNAAASTAVDKAESEPDLAMAINGVAPGILAAEARGCGAALIHYSTDYVYDGARRTPYVETDATAPQSVYGRSKLAGDRAIAAAGVPHLILRTSWVYGWRGQNFLLTMLRQSRERDELRVVADQIGTPNWSADLAQATADIVAQAGSDIRGFLEARQGTYHLSASGQTSWHGFAEAILACDPQRAEQKARRVVAITTAEYPLPAVRPAYAVLDTGKLCATFGIKLKGWQEPLETWGSFRSMTSTR